MIYSTRSFGNAASLLVIGGIIIGLSSDFSFRTELVLVAISLGLSAIFLKNKNIAAGLVLAALFAIGLSDGNYAKAQYAQRLLSIGTHEATNLKGRISNQISLNRSGRTQFDLETRAGRWLVESRADPGLALGDHAEIVSASGRSRIDSGYQEYLARSGYSGFILAQRVEVYESGSRGPGERLYDLREILRNSLIRAVPGQPGDLVAGMAFGGETVRDQALINALNITGTRHIVAISGFNIGIIGAGTLGLLLLFGLSRRWATRGAIVVLIAYVLITGLQPSAVRAAIMGGLLFFAISKGYSAVALRLAILAGAAMLLFNPLSFYDIGFQLSFAAVFGIILGAPIFKYKVFKHLPSWLSESLGVLIAVQLTVAPLILFHFGSLSLASGLFNFIILPLVPLATVFGLLVAILGLVSSTLSQILATPLILLLNFLTGVIFWGSHYPMTFDVKPGQWVLLGGLYTALSVAFLTLRDKSNYLQEADA